METHRLRRRCGVHLDGHVDQAKADRAAPDRTWHECVCIADRRFGQALTCCLATRAVRHSPPQGTQTARRDQMRGRTTMAIATTALAATAAVGIGAATAAAPKPAKTVKGSLITVQPNTLKPGTKLQSSAVGFPRVFVNANTAWALREHRARPSTRRVPPTAGRPGGPPARRCTSTPLRRRCRSRRSARGRRRSPTRSVRARSPTSPQTAASTGTGRCSTAPTWRSCQGSAQASC